jgi:type IV pilus assembly protein PilQ
MKARAIAICLLAGAAAWAQAPSPAGPVPERELVTLSRDMPLDQALRVIHAVAGQVVVDPQRRNAPIGVDIDRLPWRQALQQIAQSQGLQVVERENYTELLPPQVEGPAAAAPAPEVTLDSPEVEISAVFFQADRRALRELGIDWSTLSGGRVDVSAAHLGASQVSSSQFAVEARGNVNRSLSVDLLLRTFEERSMGEITARPQIKVRSGKQGYIQVGTDFSVTTADYAGNAITQFFSTGTILTVTPVVVSQEGVEFVDLVVVAERSALVDPVRNLISRTVARTSALLRDGEQTAIGGLYGDETTLRRAGIPLLKELPAWFFGLRYLFGYNSKRVSKTELVVLIKVEIVPSVRQRIERQLQKEEPLEEILRRQQE